MGFLSPPYTFTLCRGSCRKHNIKVAAECSGLNPVRWRQGDRHGLTLARITDAGVKTISCVQRLARHIHLRHKLAPAGCPDGKMDVGRTPGIGDGPNGAETVRTIRTGRHATIPLKSRVIRLWCINQAVDVRRSLGTFSGDALRHRHTEPSHPVEPRAADLYQVPLIRTGEP